MIKDFIEKHCGGNNKYIVMTGFVLYFFMLVFTMLFTYHSFLHYLALGFQLIFFGYNVFLFFYLKNRDISFLIFLIPFAISIGISFILNGYNGNYKTIATEFLIYISIVYFSKNIPSKKDCFFIVIVSLFVFALYFISLHFKDFINLIKVRNFSSVRFGDKIAPINMITIYCDLACSLSFIGIIEQFQNKKIKYGLILFLFYVISFGCGVLIGSKQFFVVTLLVNIISIIWALGKKRWYISVAVLGVSAGLVALLLNLPAFSTITERFTSMFDFVANNKGRDFSSASRLTMFAEAIYLFTKKPLFGYGAGGYTIHGSFGTYSHNTISNLLCEFGVFGFIAFLFLVFGPSLCSSQKENRDFKYETYIWIMLFCLVFQALFGVLYLHKFTFVILSLACIAFYDGKYSNVIYVFNSEKQKSISKDESKEMA